LSQKFCATSRNTATKEKPNEHLALSLYYSYKLKDNVSGGNYNLLENPCKPSQKNISSKFDFVYEIYKNNKFVGVFMKSWFVQVFTKVVVSTRYVCKLKIFNYIASF
jgi:hypothetical protein